MWKIFTIYMEIENETDVNEFITGLFIKNTSILGDKLA